MPSKRYSLWPALVILAILAVCLAVDAIGKLSQPAVNLPEMVIQKVELGLLESGYYPLLLDTNRGQVECQYYPAPGGIRGVVLVPGAGGGWGDAADGLYLRLCEELPGEGFTCLRVRHRLPDAPLECVLDVVAGIRYLESQGVRSVALVGHSRGGMVAIYAAVAVPVVRTVVTLASEGVRDDLVAGLGPRCSILVIHGQRDPVIRYQTAEQLYRVAQEPKRLILYPTADHSLNRVASEVYQEAHNWIAQRLGQ